MRASHGCICFGVAVLQGVVAANWSGELQRHTFTDVKISDDMCVNNVMVFVAHVGTWANNLSFDFGITEGNDGLATISSSCAHLKASEGFVGVGSDDPHECQAQLCGCPVLADDSYLCRPFEENETGDFDYARHSDIENWRSLWQTETRNGYAEPSHENENHLRIPCLLLKPSWGSSSVDPDQYCAQVLVTKRMKRRRIGYGVEMDAMVSYDPPEAGDCLYDSLMKGAGFAPKCGRARQLCVAGWQLEEHQDFLQQVACQEKETTEQYVQAIAEGRWGGYPEATVLCAVLRSLGHRVGCQRAACVWSWQRHKNPFRIQWPALLPLEGGQAQMAGQSSLPGDKEAVGCPPRPLQPQDVCQYSPSWAPTYLPLPSRRQP